ncbi:hypothetical protein F5Y17DRAFT_462961 [Xylariaceae sp. FL0594]|nr:hypothetical protein F5Y17DRAFT_462961 [Xylariaceae sp. FL0594]
MAYSSSVSATATNALAILAISGILSHRLYFIRGEHHLKGPQYIATWALAVLAAASYMAYIKVEILKPLLLGNIAFFGPLYTSIVVYRVFEHPLRHFDGPPLAAVSKIWHFAHMFTTQNHLFLDGIIKRYGDFFIN